jgi:hypothetical protein
MTDDDASPPSVNLELPERHLMTQGPPSHAIMSISTRTDISPTSSGSSNYPRTVADQVGGCGLTLTHMAQKLIRLAPGKASIRLKRKTAGWDDDFLASHISR